MEIKELLSKLTAEEKAALVSGTDFMFTNRIPRLNGHLIKGIKCFCTKIKVPALPKEKEEKR